MVLGFERLGRHRRSDAQRRQADLAVLQFGVGVVGALDVGPQESGKLDDLAAGREVHLGAGCLAAGRRDAVMRTCTLLPRTSAICEAMVRFHTSSYRAASSAPTSLATCSGIRKLSPAGRMASWASSAFFTFFSYRRGLAGT